MSKVLVIGAGYVGLAYSCLLARDNLVTIDEIDEEKRSKLKRYENPYNEELITNELKKNKSNINLFHSDIDDYNDFDFAFLCLPTNYDEESNSFNLDALEKKIYLLNENKFKGLVIIKSTVPVGFTDKISSRFKSLNILFSPEFLREGSSFKDVLNPSRLICGGNLEHSKKFVNLMQIVQSIDAKIFYMTSSEAESVKLFSNTYLAMRVSFFNELDSYCIMHNLNTKNIIEGVSSDTRIGDFYNNPSFGYGGYCLPKDTKQLLANFEGVPQNLISSIINTNTTRKKFLAKTISNNQLTKTIGVYRLIMKKDSDNYRESSVIGIIEELADMGCKVVIYEPEIIEESILGCEIENNFIKFCAKADLIISNRWDDKLNNIDKEIFTRDVFKRD